MSTDLTEAIELLALTMTGRRGSKYEATTWQELGPQQHAIFRAEAKEQIDLVAPLLEKALRQQIAADIEAAIPDAHRRHEPNCQACLTRAIYIERHAAIARGDAR